MTSLLQSLNSMKSYLASNEALQSIERDPYWPKWDSPWWHMSLLHEMGLAKEIPQTAIAKMVQVLKNHYLPIFPTKPGETPPGTDPYLRIACICAVGNMYQILFNAGVNVDRELPWMRPWFFRYQLPDGGLNCDEQAYSKPTPKSSIVTTVSCLESVFFCRNRDLTEEEIDFLNKGASYLLKQKLFRRASTGEVVDPDWLEIRFPRFYEYDFLRGYYFLEKWRRFSGFSIPDDLVEEVEKLVSRQMTNEGIKLKRYNFFDKRSYNPIADNQWTWGEASEIDLMKRLSFEGSLCDSLTAQWNEVKPMTAMVSESYETVYKNPIKLKIGESVQIEKRETNPEWLGWVYCVDSRGVAGWVSEKYLQESGSTALVVKDYDATELTASTNESLTIYYEEFGWYWCRNSSGIKGWIPKKNLRLIGESESIKSSGFGSEKQTSLPQLKIERPSKVLYQEFTYFVEDMRLNKQPLWETYLLQENESPEEFIERLLNREFFPEITFVPETVYWATYDGHVVGRISLRHHLNEKLSIMGGHIGYEVSPKWRKRGFATEMLRQILLTSKAKDIGKLLLTCSPHNEASNKTIINNGGQLTQKVFVDSIGEDRNHYWITLEK